MTHRHHPNRCILSIDGNVAWQFNHYVPVLWPWLFFKVRPTESRKLFTTVYEAAETFESLLVYTDSIKLFLPLRSIMSDLAPGEFSRSLGVRPDAVLSWDLLALEQTRPYGWEKSVELWEKFFRVCESNETSQALQLWDEANLNPLRLYTRNQQTSHGLAARAEELGLHREERGEAFVRFLFGEPVARFAQPLHQQWVGAANKLPWVGQQIRRSWWRRILKPDGQQ